MITYKPLERVLKDLETSAREGDTETFLAQTELFYKWLPRLDKYRSWMGANADQLVRHYQSRYDQVRMLWKGKIEHPTRQQKDVGQLMEGSD